MITHFFDPENLDQDAENKDLNGMKVIVYKTKVNGYQKKNRIETKVIVYKKM